MNCLRLYGCANRTPSDFLCEFVHLQLVLLCEALTSNKVSQMKPNLLFHQRLRLIILFGMPNELGACDKSRRKFKIENTQIGFAVSNLKRSVSTYFLLEYQPYIGV